MQDSSPFRWLKERGPARQLIAVIDGATSRFYARFTEHDTTEENLRTLEEWLRHYGRPLAHYTDKNSIFRTSAAALLGEQLRGEKARSLLGRAPGGVGNRMDCSTQSAGQRADRAIVRNAAGPLSKRNAPGWNRQYRSRESFLEMRFLPAWEERFTVAPRSPRNAHRRLDPQRRLEEILSVRAGRQVADNHTVSWDGNRWGVPREEVCAGLRGAQVEIE